MYGFIKITIIINRRKGVKTGVYKQAISCHGCEGAALAPLVLLLNSEYTLNVGYWRSNEVNYWRIEDHHHECCGRALVEMGSGWIISGGGGAGGDFVFCAR